MMGEKKNLQRESVFGKLRLYNKKALSLGTLAL